MAFASHALDAHYRTGRRIGVTDIFKNLGWRSMIYMRLGQHWFMIVFRFTIGYFIWLLIRLTSKVLGCCGCGDGSFASSSNIREWILTSTIRFTSFQRKAKWTLFWSIYFVFAKHSADFVIDYCEAWRHQPNIDMEIIMFVDNGCRLAVPCSSSGDDKDLMEHLHVFYDLIRTRGGVFEFFGAKSSQRIDIVELQHTYAVGKRIGASLNLGRHGPYNRQIHYFKDPSNLIGTDLKDRLLVEGVLTVRTQQTRAINIVRTWDPYVTSIIILLPVALSFTISVAWSIVASVHYKADAQVSTQTGFTVGSYVVTAGTLLVALVAFLDTKYNTSEAIPPEISPVDTCSHGCQQSNQSI